MTRKSLRSNPADDETTRQIRADLRNMDAKMKKIHKVVREVDFNDTTARQYDPDHVVLIADSLDRFKERLDELAAEVIWNTSRRGEDQP